MSNSIYTKREDSLAGNPCLKRALEKNLLLGTVNVWVSTAGAFCDSFRKGPRTSSMKACSLPYQSLIVASTSFRSLSLALAVLWQQWPVGITPPTINKLVF